jgi:hypothetical protein
MSARMRFNCAKGVRKGSLECPLFESSAKLYSDCFESKLAMLMLLQPERVRARRY